MQKSILLALTLSLFLTSCGFRLKGSYDLPANLKTIYVSSAKQFSPITKTLKTRLLQNQVQVITSSQQGVTELRVLPEKFQRQTLSLLPNGQIAEYKLVYQVEYQIRQPNNEQRTFRFELSREFQDDPNNALAKERERELILSELRIMASDRILAQLSSVN